jgi:hypothetical protein
MIICTSGRRAGSPADDIAERTICIMRCATNVNMPAMMLISQPPDCIHDRQNPSLIS